MWHPLVIGIGLLIFGVVYQLVWSAQQRRPRPPTPPDIIKWGVPVNDPDSAVGAGWFVEVDGQRVAELTEPRCQVDTPHWLSYVIVPLTDDPKMREQLYDLRFWHSERPAYRSRKFGALALGALVSGVPPCPETHRIIILRGPYIHLDPGPSLVDRVVGLFKRGRDNA
jgi:hypothetical protein